MSVPLKMRWTVIVAAAGLGAEGLGSAFIGPGADLGIITAAWIAMLLTLGHQAGVELERNTAVKIVGAILLSLASFLGGSKLAIQAFALTGVGTFPAMIANLGINAVITYSVGMSVAQLFVQDKKINSVETFVGAVIQAVLASLGMGGGNSAS